jgi:hypothetical protein
MKTTAHTTVAERIGRGLGRIWLAIQRQEARVVQHLGRQGLSRGVATPILWAVKLLVLGIFLYVAFWMTLVAVFVLAAAWLARHADHSVIWVTAPDCRAADDMMTRVVAAMLVAQASVRDRH